MKLIFYILLLSALNCSSQTFSATAIRQGWANGKCCAHGVNYTITIHTSSVNPDSIKIISACVDEKFLLKNQIKRISNSKNKKLILVLSWSENNEENLENEIIDESTKPKHNTLPICKSKNKLMVQLGKNYKSIDIKIIKDIPPIPYP